MMKKFRFIWLVVFIFSCAYRCNPGNKKNCHSQFLGFAPQTDECSDYIKSARISWSNTFGR